MKLRDEWRDLKKAHPQIEKESKGYNLGPALENYEEAMEKGDKLVAEAKKTLEAAYASYDKGFTAAVAAMGAVGLYYQKVVKPLAKTHVQLEKDVRNFKMKVDRLETLARDKRNALPKL